MKKSLVRKIREDFSMAKEKAFKLGLNNGH